HFFGGGGNNVKHGDLEEALLEPSRELDVHMASDGANMQCTDCHITEKHNIRGKLYSLSSMNRNRVTCEQCHGNTPHTDDLLNEHTLKVACQTCHIPTYAKENATMVYWDWSTAGKLRDGKPYEEKDAEGNIVYLSKKGSFRWGKNLKPDYVWFNGTADHYLPGDRVTDPSQPVAINRLAGSYADPDAKIVPVKIMRTRQFYDPVTQLLLLPKLFAPEHGVGALWKDFDPVKAVEVGMKERGLPFSGRVDFVETVMYWPINHMVAPKENVVKCTECHTRQGSRIANLTDFYIPGRDYSPKVEAIGKSILWLSLLGVLAHGGMRMFSAWKRNKEGNP
ncbi:MAG: tetrathionate reductase family octaheme c-type cytochrome, partial [bacterium]|nr:tetrathionate reductase family octaheme c-type cytochrome [bacterium]